MSFFVADTAFGDVGVSILMAGAPFSKIFVDSRSAKYRIFQYKMRCRGGALRTDGFSFAISCSDHARIVRHIDDASTVFGNFLFGFGAVLFCVAGAVFDDVGG